MDEPKLIRLVRHPEGHVRAYVGDQELLLVRFVEDYGNHGHTVTLTILNDQVQWTETK